MVRRLGTAWRVGRLRIALPRLAHETVATVDRDLAMIPRLDELADGDLVDLLDRTRRELATTHAYEVLTGMLLGSAGRALGRGDGGTRVARRSSRRME